MTPERTGAADAAIKTHAPPGRTTSRGGPEKSQDFFGAILDQHQARTAVAEGHKEKGATKSPDSKPKKDATPQVAGRRSQVAGNDTDSDQTVDAQAPAVAPDAEAVLAAAAAVALTVAPAVVVQPAPAAGTAVQAPVAEGPAVPVLPAQAQTQAQGPAMPVAPEQGQVPVVAEQAAAAVAAPVVEQPVVAAKPADAPQAQQPVPTDKPADAQAPAQAPVLPDNKQSDAQSSGQGQQPAPQAPAQQVAPNSAAPADKPVADAIPTSTAQPTQPTGHKPAEAVAAPQVPAQPTDPAGVQTPVAQPAAPSTPAAPVQASRFEPAAGMRLHQAVETVQAIVKMGQANGVTRARVALRPESLGGIEIHLSSTKDGVSARLVADAAQAANVLRHAGEELRRSLESQGINLVRFDVGTAGGDGEQRSTFGNEPGNSGSNGRNQSGSMEETEVPTDPTQETTVQLPNGVLVDVLA